MRPEDDELVLFPPLPAQRIFLSAQVVVALHADDPAKILNLTNTTFACVLMVPNMLERLLRIVNEPLGVCEGLIMSISTLRRVIEKLNDEHGRWWLEEPLVVHLSADHLPTIQVFHSRSGPDQVTDELGWMVPVIGDPTINDHSLVALAPELIQSSMEGLYLENGRVLSDFITDFERFWKPLEQAL